MRSRDLRGESETLEGGGVAATIRIGVDTGGTFTDLVAIDDTTYEILVVKKPSTPPEPSKAVFDALEDLSRPLEHASALALGTTLATNALLTRRGARVLYLTTAGFEDIPHLQRADKKDPYDLQAVRPDPLVARADCLGVLERVDHLGQVVQPLTDAALVAAGDLVEARLRHADGRPTAIAVSLLFAFAYPDHEQRLGDYLKGRFPGFPSPSHIMWRRCGGNMSAAARRSSTRTSSPSWTHL